MQWAKSVAGAHSKQLVRRVQHDKLYRVEPLAEARRVLHVVVEAAWCGHEHVVRVAAEAARVGFAVGATHRQLDVHVAPVELAEASVSFSNLQRAHARGRHGDAADLVEVFFCLRHSRNDLDGGNGKG